MGHQVQRRLFIPLFSLFNVVIDGACLCMHHNTSIPRHSLTNFLLIIFTIIYIFSKKRRGILINKEEEPHTQTTVINRARVYMCVVCEVCGGIVVEKVIVGFIEVDGSVVVKVVDDDDDVEYSVVIV